MCAISISVLGDMNQAAVLAVAMRFVAGKQGDITTGAVRYIFYVQFHITEFCLDNNKIITVTILYLKQSKPGRANRSQEAASFRMNLKESRLRR